MSIVRKLALSLCTVLPLSAFAAGGHDTLDCTGCHSLHAAKGEIIFAVGANKTAVDPKTKQPYGGTTALCLGCHQESKNGGQDIDPISAHVSHPFSVAKVNEKVAKVPGELLRGGKFECLGCHDPHPSNTNYRYLRVDSAGGKKMEKFCQVCHAMKADPASVSSVALFTSMDETATRATAVLKPVEAPARKPGAEKKPAAAEKKK